MIEVEVQYRQRCVKNKNNDYFVYPYFLVRGHANNGTSVECIRVCAGISACVIGIQRLIDYNQYSVKCKSGLFEIILRKSLNDHTFVDEDTNYALNTLLCQLFDLKNMYPTQFSRFDMIEIKGEVKNHEERKPKPFRQLKSERLGVCSNKEGTNRKKN